MRIRRYDLVPLLPADSKPAVYGRKSDADEPKSKSREQQVQHAVDACAALCWKEITVERIYAEADGVKGQWWWEDRAGHHAGPFRPELTRLVHDIEAGEVNAVVVWRTDRLYRDSGVADKLLKFFVAHNVRLYVKTHDLAIHTASGFQAAMAEASANRGWRDRISEDIQRDHDDKAKRGMFSRDPSVLGFKSRGKGTQAVDPIPEQLQLVNRIFRLFVVGEGDGPLGISGVCRTLMDEGTRISFGMKGHKAKNPDRIHTSQIKTILQNCMYVGQWRHNGDEYPCDRLLVSDPLTGVPATAVPTELFQAAQERIRAMPKRGHKAAYSEHLLSGVAICGKCGRPLQFSSKLRKDGTKRWTLLCVHKRDTLMCDREGIVNLSEDQLDEWATTHLAPWIAAEMRALREAHDSSADQSKLHELERLLREAQKKEIEKLTAIIGVLDEVQIGLIAARFRAERESIERQVRDLKAVVGRGPVCSKIDLDLSNLSQKAVKAAIRSAMRWIAVTKHGVVAMTQWNTYVGGALVGITPTVWNAPEPRRAILPPSPASCADCLTWLPDTATFVSGRRLVHGKRSDLMLDEEFLPGHPDLHPKENM